MLSKEIRDLLLEENAKIKIDEDILYYGEARQRERHYSENIEVIELMHTLEHKFDLTINKVTQEHLNKLSLVSYSVRFSDSGRFLILTKDMESILLAYV